MPRIILRASASMIYPSDFNSNYSKSVGSISSFPILHIPPSRLKVKSRKVHPTPLLESHESTWIRYCSYSTVHGLRYLTDPKIRSTERYKTKMLFVCVRLIYLLWITELHGAY